jgi:hypothetical protein
MHDRALVNNKKEKEEGSRREVADAKEMKTREKVRYDGHKREHRYL